MIPGRPRYLHEQAVDVNLSSAGPINVSELIVI